MKWLGMLPKEGPPEEPKTDIPLFTSTTYVKVKHGGIFFPKFYPGDEVKKGDLMAEVKDLFGNIIEQVISPVDGVVNCIFPKRVKISGDNAYQIWNKE